MSRRRQGTPGALPPQPPSTTQGTPVPFPQLPASMCRAPAVAASLAFLESSILPMFTQRSPTMPRKRPRKPRKMAVIMSARQAWMYPGEVGRSHGSLSWPLAPPRPSQPLLGSQPIRALKSSPSPSGPIQLKGSHGLLPRSLPRPPGVPASAPHPLTGLFLDTTDTLALCSGGGGRSVPLGCPAASLAFSH